MSADRRRFIGGSDVAGILGLSPWKSPLDVYLSKTSDAPEEINEERALFFKRRKRQEPIVVEILRDEYRIEVTKVSTDEDPNRYRDEEYPFLAAEIDFEFTMSDQVREVAPLLAAIPDGTTLNGEIKTVHPFKAHEWGEQGSEEQPVYYAAQVYHGLGVTRRPGALTAALFGVDSVSVFPSLNDPEVLLPMRAKCVAFWNEHVVPRVPPDPQTMRDIKYLFTLANTQPVEITPAIYAQLQRLDELRAHITACEKEKEYLELDIESGIVERWKPATEGDNPVLLVDGLEVGSWKRQRGTFLDQRRLKAEHPEIIEQYTKEHHYRILRLKKAKK